MTIAIAIYGAVIGTLGFGWQAWVRWQDHRLRIKVTVDMSLVAQIDRTVTVLVEVKAASRTGHPVKVTNAGLRIEGSGQWWGMTPHPQASIPGQLAPHDAVRALFDPSGLAKTGLDLRRTHTVRGGIELATGEKIWSEPTQLGGS